MTAQFCHNRDVYVTHFVLPVVSGVTMASEVTPAVNLKEGELLLL